MTASPHKRVTTKLRIGDFCRLVKGTSPTMKTEPGPYPLVVTADYRRTSDTFQFDEKAVCIPLVSSTGHGDAAIHRVHYAKGKFALANLLVALLPDQTKCSAKFLYYLLTTKKDTLLVPLMQGTSNVSLKVDDISGVLVELPPLQEQRRIAERIEYLLNKAAILDQLHLAVVDKPKALLATEEMRVWPNEALVDARSLEEVTVHLARGRQSEQGQSEHYLIKTQHVQDRKYIPSKMTLAPHVASKVTPEAMVEPGDILIACSAAGCLGRTAFFQDVGTVASTDTHVAIARANRDVVLPEYLYAYLRGAQGQFQLRSREKGDWQREKVGFRFTELNVSDMRRVPVPIPGLQEQRKIVEFLERLTLKIDALRNHQAKRAVEVAALRPSVLNSAFSGQL